MDPEKKARLVEAARKRRDTGRPRRDTAPRVHLPDPFAPVFTAPAQLMKSSAASAAPTPTTAPPPRAAESLSSLGLEEDLT